MQRPPDPALWEAYRRIAATYAHVVDGGEPDLLDAIASADCVVEGPGFRLEGRDALRGIPQMLRESYRMTRHVVHNQTVAANGEHASGETYCTAHHVSATDDGAWTAWIWSLRYRDTLLRRESEWRLRHRVLLVDWTETRPISPGIQGAWPTIEE